MSVVDKKQKPVILKVGLVRDEKEKAENVNQRNSGGLKMQYLYYLR